MTNRRSKKAHAHRSNRGYARTARVNEVLREVLAEQLERMEVQDERLGMLTITGVQCEPDLRHATVLMSSMGESQIEALGAMRVSLQAAISRELRLRRTPQLRFTADPAVAAGQRVEEILARIPHSADVEPSEHPGEPGAAGGAAEVTSGGGGD
ncbi:MAG: 30S ribosome-binding factor RbfA [Acidimicrobiales bacterium]